MHSKLVIIMEYCEDGDLYDQIEQRSRSRNPDLFPEEQIMKWFGQLVLGLNYIHSQKILHRDLKTQNIFLASVRNKDSWTLKLGDFGIVKVLENTEAMANTQIGTPYYMSPELISSLPYTYQSDVWALGCILHEMLSCKHAFQADNFPLLAIRIKGSFQPLPSTCSYEMKSLVARMLSVEAGDRPSLRDILHLPFIKRRIGGVLKSTLCSSRDVDVSLCEVVIDQLHSLGLKSCTKELRAMLTQMDADRQEQLGGRALRKMQNELLKMEREASAMKKRYGVRGSLYLRRLDGSFADENDASPVTYMMSDGEEYTQQAPRSRRLSARRQESLPPNSKSMREQLLERKRRRKEEEIRKYDEEAEKIRQQNRLHTCKQPDPYRVSRAMYNALSQGQTPRDSQPEMLPQGKRASKAGIRVPFISEKDEMLERVYGGGKNSPRAAHRLRAPVGSASADSLLPDIVPTAPARRRGGPSAARKRGSKGSKEGDDDIAWKSLSDGENTLPDIVFGDRQISPARKKSRRDSAKTYQDRRDSSREKGERTRMPRDIKSGGRRKDDYFTTSSTRYTPSPSMEEGTQEVQIISPRHNIHSRAWSRLSNAHHAQRQRRGRIE
uniref:non-specific serine/threonine protein kinase n=1 Tax=Vitrella brassicaformis TaxID=1169539 RepID=A0A7S1PAF6_9ALVE